MAHRIVVCDDERHISLAVGMKLKKAGFNVEETQDGMSGLEAIQRDVPDLLIVDCQMPRMGGLELCRRLRAEPATEHLPIIMLTAKGYELDLPKIQSELWLSHIVFKPFSPRELLNTVESTLGLLSQP